MRVLRRGAAGAICFTIVFSNIFLQITIEAEKREEVAFARALFQKSDTCSVPQEVPIGVK